MTKLFPSTTALDYVRATWGANWMRHLQLRLHGAVIVVSELSGLVTDPYFDIERGANDMVGLMQMGLLVVAPVTPRAVELFACLRHECGGQLPDRELWNRAVALAYFEEEEPDLRYLTMRIDHCFDLPQKLYEVAVARDAANP